MAMLPKVMWPNASRRSVGFRIGALVEQIRRFRVGLRKPDPAQGESLQMHAMAMRFPSLDEAREIALYIDAHLPAEPDAEP